MKFNFEIKKGVIGLVFLLLGISIALTLVFGQGLNYINWANPYYPPGQPSTFNNPTIQTTFPSHPLQLISISSSMPTYSVDSNGNGIIDNAEYSRWAGVALFANLTSPQKFNCTKVFDGYDTISQYYQGNNANIAKVTIPSYCMDRECKLIVYDANAGSYIRVADYYQTPSGIGTVGVGLTGGINFWEARSYSQNAIDNVDWDINGDSNRRPIVNLPNLGGLDSWLVDDYSGNSNPAFNEVTSTLWAVHHKASQGTQIFACG